MLYSYRYSIVVGDQMFCGCKILILPKSNQICPNLNLFCTNFAQICPNFAQILPEFAQILPKKINFLGGGAASRAHSDTGFLSSCSLTRDSRYWYSIVWTTRENFVFINFQMLIYLNFIYLKYIYILIISNFLSDELVGNMEQKFSWNPTKLIL